MARSGDGCHTEAMRHPRATIAAITVLALGCGGVVLAGCGDGGGGSTTPATTAADGRNVYDPSHNVISLGAGPKFIIRMPDAGAGSSWRLTGTESVGGISLSGMSEADGTGDWNFDTIGAGGGVLEFQRFLPGATEPDETVTFEVEIK